MSVGPVERTTSDDASHLPLCTNGLKTTGIEPADLRQILELGNLAPEKGDLGVLSSGDWALWGLLSTNVFHIYRRWPKGEEAKTVFDYFTWYITAQLNNVAEHGYWPHYRRQAADSGIPFDGFTVDLGAMESPRHMIREWRVTCVNGVPVQAQPDKWVGFFMLGAYPDLRTKAFALRVEAERQTGLERVLFPRAHVTSDGKIVRYQSKQQQPTVSDYVPNDPATVEWKANPINPNCKEDRLGDVLKPETRMDGSKRARDGDRQVPVKKQQFGY